MATATTIKAVGNWNQKMAVTLDRALAVSRDLFRRSGPQACRHAVILMAQSASKMAPKAKKNRKVEYEGKNRYVTTYSKDQGGSHYGPKRVYQRQFALGSDRPLEGTWEKAKLIANCGMAKRSWMWGLKQGKGYGPKGSSGVGTFKVGLDRVGFYKRNKLSYILKIMPSGWLRQVTEMATNRIMAQAARKLEKQFKQKVQRGR